MRMRVFVRLKPGVLDVQGKAIERAIGDLGFENVSQVRIGKLIEFDVEADSADAARAKAEEMCKKFLVNPIMEQFEIGVAE